MQTFILGFWPDYETFFFEETCKIQSQFRIHQPKQQSFISKVLPKSIYRSYYRHSIKQLFNSHPQADFICNENMSLLHTILKYKKNHRIHLLLRNPIRTKPKLIDLLPELRAQNIQIWSFDPVDCDDFNLRFYPQFISPIPELSHIKPTFDFTFVGRAKNREQSLGQLTEKMDKANLNFYFQIVQPSVKAMDYKAYLKENLKGRCIVDITQAMQTGMTLRPLEAAFYQRKLITNNLNILEHPLWDTNNVLILNDSLTASDLADFMMKPYHPYSPEILNRFQSHIVLNHIIGQSDRSIY